MAKLEF